MCVRLFCSILCLTLWPVAAHAYFQLEMMKNKVVDRKNVQWTLADWLAQKKKISQQNRWLAMNRSPNLVDLTLSGGYRETENQDSGSKAGHQVYSADAYIKLFNIYGEYELKHTDIENYGGALGLRLWGNSTQDSSLVARYGWRRRRNHQSHQDWENQYAEGVLQLYVFSFLGLEGEYRHLMPATSSQGTKLEGTRQSAAVFVELSLFRLYAGVFKEDLELKTSSVITNEKSEGIEGGLRLMF